MMFKRYEGKRGKSMELQAKALDPITSVLLFPPYLVDSFIPFGVKDMC
jgi:hypothetical protein